MTACLPIALLNSVVRTAMTGSDPKIKAVRPCCVFCGDAPHCLWSLTRFFCLFHPTQQQDAETFAVLSQMQQSPDLRFRGPFVPTEGSFVQPCAHFDGVWEGDGWLAPCICSRLCLSRSVCSGLLCGCWHGARALFFSHTMAGQHFDCANQQVGEWLGNSRPAGCDRKSMEWRSHIR